MRPPISGVALKSNLLSIPCEPREVTSYPVETRLFSVVHIPVERGVRKEFFERNISDPPSWGLRHNKQLAVDCGVGLDSDSL